MKYIKQYEDIDENYTKIINILYVDIGFYKK